MRLLFLVMLCAMTLLPVTEKQALAQTRGGTPWSFEAYPRALQRKRKNKKGKKGKAKNEKQVERRNVGDDPSTTGEATIDRIPPFRDERGVSKNGEFISLLMQYKHLKTSAAAPLPTTDTAIGFYDTICLADTYDALPEANQVFLEDPSRTMVGLVPRWAYWDGLPMPSQYVIRAPPNSTSVCGVLELYELYLNRLVLDVPFDDIPNVLNEAISRLNNFVGSWSKQLKTCLQDDIGTKGPNGRLVYTVDTFLYRGKAFGIRRGPFESQFWLLPYLEQNTLHPTAPTLLKEKYTPGKTGTYLNFLKAQTRPELTHDTSTSFGIGGTFSYHATAVHSDYLLSRNVFMLDLLSTSNLRPWGCTGYRANDGELLSEEKEFFVCAGIMAFYKQFVSMARYSLAGAFLAKRKFNRLRPEQMAYLIARLADPNDGVVDVGQSADCFDISRSGCVDEGIPREICEKLTNGRQSIVTGNDIQRALPFFAEVVNSPSSRQFLRYLTSEGQDCLFLWCLYPEGSPVHDSFPAGHAVYAGSSATALSSFYCLYASESICQGLEDDWRALELQGPPELVKWKDLKLYDRGKKGITKASLRVLFANMPGYPPLNGDPKRSVWKSDGNRVIPAPPSASFAKMTVWGEIVKLTKQYSHARDRAGVHYYTDGCAGNQLGEIMTIRYIIEQLKRRPAGGKGELNVIVKPLLDGRHIVIRRDGYRFWGEPDAPFSLHVNKILNTSPQKCRSSRTPIQLKEVPSFPLREKFKRKK